MSDMQIAGTAHGPVCAECGNDDLDNWTSEMDFERRETTTICGACGAEYSRDKIRELKRTQEVEI